MNTDSNIKVALVSSGLGNVARGFETSTGRLYHALRKFTSLDVRLFAGGNYSGATKLWNFPRNSIWTAPIRYFPISDEKRKWEVTYGVEQISFWSALNFELLAWKPDVVWVKDVPLAHLLGVSRLIFGLQFKLIFANGSRFKPKTYEQFDLIQQIQTSCYDKAVVHGIPRRKMVVLSNCVPTPVGQLADRQAVRKRLGFGSEDWIVVCVAAWNRYHKRIDYLLQEVASIRDHRVKLLLCGTPEVDTTSLQRLGNQLLGDRVRWLTVPETEIASILKASDVFVLPSLHEGLGNALIEAALMGMPIVAHPHEGAQFSIADDYWFVDLSQEGNLSKRLKELRDVPVPVEKCVQLKESVALRFDEESQARVFTEMVRQAVGNSKVGI